MTVPKYTALAIVLSIAVVVLIGIAWALLQNNSRYSYNSYSNPLSPLPGDQITGWVAWWNESDALTLIENNSESIHTVSPVWFMVNSDFELSEIGEVDKRETARQLKENGHRLIPTLASDLTGEQLSPLFYDEEKITMLANELAIKAHELNADGIDIDLEVILKPEREVFSKFLSTISERLHADGLIMTVDVHAQTDQVVWEGVEGQDLKRIGEIADEVRVMTYDEHSASSPPGPLASLQWIEKVLTYTEKRIPKEKIVVGIPTYGYIWSDESARPLQFDEFNSYIQHDEYAKRRDTASGEVVIETDDLTGWLSDANAMVAKMNLARSLGYNKFAIWHFGGMDEAFFTHASTIDPLRN